MINAMLTRGELAEQGGVNPETIRYYERNDLIPAPARSQSNYRLYDAGAVERIRFIKRAQRVGFTLEQIRGLLAIRFSPRATCGDVREVVDEKINQVDAQINQLLAMRETLVELRADCPGGEHPLEECPILDHFAHSVQVSEGVAHA